MIVTRIRKVIVTRRRKSLRGEDNYDKDRESDLDEENRQGEEDHKEVKRQGE